MKIALILRFFTCMEFFVIIVIRKHYTKEFAMFFFKKKNKPYKSCDMIEHGMDFGYKSINLCCRMPRTKNEYYPVIDNYDGREINWKFYFKEKRKFRELMKQGKLLPECENCIYLEEKEWDNEDYIEHINFNYGLKCNQRCIYCDFYYNPSPQKQYNVYPAIKNMTEKGYLSHNANITIAGGEPCVIPEFEDLLKIFTEYKVAHLRVLTNASVYNPALEEAIKCGYANMVVSVDSGTEETFKKIKNADFYDTVWQNIKKYASVQQTDSNVITKYIIIPNVNDNREEIAAWLNKSTEAGIKSVCLDVEANYYEQNQNHIAENIPELISFVIEQTKLRNLELDLMNRSKMLAIQYRLEEGK